MINYVLSIILGHLHNLLFKPQNAAKEVLSSPLLFTFYKHTRKLRLRGAKKELASGIWHVAWDV